MIVAYERISKNTEHLENQRHLIMRYTAENSIIIDKWVSEVKCGAAPLEGRRLNQVLRRIKRDDIKLIVVAELSRLGRSLYQVMGIIDKVLSSGCALWIAKEDHKLDTGTISQMQCFAWSLSAQIERELISSRTKAALARLKAEGKKLGRPVGSRTAFRRLDGKREHILSLLSGGMAKSTLAKRLRISVPTLYRFLSEYEHA
ncbi:MAG: recombinase family protein [Rickettsiales bacterium]|jgi:DNA invertase Pin-like site-specific DNA recombinase|nr:recombinase family protein [Rickettsiales bacterium]